MISRMKDTLLLIGDRNSDRANLHDIFESSYYILEAEDTAQGIMLLEQNIQCIAAVLTDIPLTDDCGLPELVSSCRPSEGKGVPVVCLVTPSGTGQREETAFILGAADVVYKPYTTLSVQRRVQTLIDLYMHQWHLEKLVEDQSQTIRNTNQVMVDTLSAIIEHRNTESGNHVLRIRRFTQLLLQEVARCCPEYELNDNIVDRISTASSLHDIGKISIPDVILNKPDLLTPEEYEIMKTHATIGAQLAEQIGDIGDPLYLRYIYNICLYHHERWDGTGYPKGLTGNDIPICAQVVGLVDAYDALTTPRTYKSAYSHEKAVNMILNGECGAFSPQLLECFKRILEDFKDLAHRYADGYSPKSDQIRIPLPGPVHMAHRLDALELSQLKYQSILHHLNDTIVELDIDKHTYHVVYNPDPDFVTLFSNATFEQMSRQLMLDGAHPANTESMEQMQQQIREELFHQHKRKISFRCQIFSHIYEEDFPYEITILRVNTGVPDQRIVIAIFHNLEDSQLSASTTPKKLPDFFALYGLSSGALRCHMDEKLTIKHGSGTLFPLTGYTEEEIRDIFGNSLLNMILPEDRSVFVDTLRTEKIQTEMWEKEYRILCKNRGPVWVLGKSRFAIDEDGNAICYHLLTDITASKEREAALMHKASLHQALMDLSEGVVVELDMVHKTLHCSDLWQKRFGYPLSITDFVPQPDQPSHIHPDDIPLIQHKIKDIIRSKESGSIDIRIANSDGRYLWSRIRTRAIYNTNGIPTRLIALIYDIDELKRDALAMKKQAELDSLTKLLNKNSAQQMVINHLENPDPNAMSALLLLDLDNFKTVNDTLGHLYGDAVLTQIGTNLRNLFRSQDVIGRIGGDEFLIFLKNIPSQEIVLERCQLLVDTFREQLNHLMPKLPISVSVGAAIAPLHGNTFADLFQHADEALYAAKRAGKCQFCLYDAQDAYKSLSKAMLHTRIDSDDQPTDSGEALVRYVFHQLYKSRNMDDTINQILAFIGTHFNVSRVYIFENNEDNTTCSNTFEWCNEGIEPQLDFLQNLNYEEDLPGWKEVYEPTGVLYCSDVSELAPHIRAIVEPQGIKSMLHCAIMDRGVFRGYVGFDDCNDNFLWTQGQVSLLQFMAEVLAVFLVKERSSKQK